MIHTIHDPEDGLRLVETLATCEAPAHPDKVCMIVGPGWCLTHEADHDQEGA